MAKYEQRLIARRLRREKGMGIKSIAKELSVAKSSVSRWCRDIELSQSQKRDLHKRMVALGHKGRMMGASMNKRMRQERMEKYEIQAREQLDSLDKRDLLITLVALYWGEGGKTQLGRFVFSNSDPEMILFLKKSLTEVMEVKEEDFTARVLINEIHKPRIHKVLRFWKSLLDLPAEQFRSPTFVRVRPKKVYENYDRYYGTLKLSVRCSSGLQYKVLGLIKALKKEAGVAQW